MTNGKYYHDDSALKAAINYDVDSKSFAELLEGFIEYKLNIHQTKRKEMISRDDCTSEIEIYERILSKIRREINERESSYFSAQAKQKLENILGTKYDSEDC